MSRFIFVSEIKFLHVISHRAISKKNGMLAYLCIFMDKRLFCAFFLLLKLQQRRPYDPIITSKAALTCSLCYQPSEKGEWWDARQDKQRHFSHLMVEEQCRKRWTRGKDKKRGIRRRKEGWSRSSIQYSSLFLILTCSVIHVSFQHDLPLCVSWLLRQKFAILSQEDLLLLQMFASYPERYERDVILFSLKHGSLVFMK